jgi:hypothetical protein
MEAPPTSVILCTNRMHDKAEMEEALVHELVHVFDVSGRYIGCPPRLDACRQGSHGVVALLLQHAVKRLDLTDCHQLAYRWVRRLSATEMGNRGLTCSRVVRQRGPCGKRGGVPLLLSALQLVQAAVCQEHGHTVHHCKSCALWRSAIASG